MNTQILLDEREIHRLMIEYFDRIDALDPLAAAAVFTEDAEADLMTGRRLVGRSRIGRTLGHILLQYRHTSHHISNHRAEVTGDTASALTYIYAFHRFPDDSVWHLWCRHADQLARTADGWRIVERILVPIDSTPAWELIDDAWYRPHPGRRSHDELRAELEAGKEAS